MIFVILFKYTKIWNDLLWQNVIKIFEFEFLQIFGHLGLNKIWIRFIKIFFCLIRKSWQIFEFGLPQIHCPLGQTKIQKSDICKYYWKRMASNKAFSNTLMINEIMIWPSIKYLHPWCSWTRHLNWCSNHKINKH